jgi:hypothetical protein
MKTSNKQFDQLFKQKMQELHFEASDTHISELLKQTKQQHKLLRNKTWGKLSIILIIVNAAVFFQLRIRYNAKPPRYQAQNNFENLTSFTLANQATFTDQITNLNTQLVKSTKVESSEISILNNQNIVETEENWQKLAKKSLHEKTKLNAYHSKHAPAISGLFLFEGEKLKEEKASQTQTIVCGQNKEKTKIIIARSRVANFKADSLAKENAQGVCRPTGFDDDAVIQYNVFDKRALFGRFQAEHIHWGLVRTTKIAKPEKPVKEEKHVSEKEVKVPKAPKAPEKTKAKATTVAPGTRPQVHQHGVRQYVEPEYEEYDYFLKNDSLIFISEGVNFVVLMQPDGTILSKAEIEITEPYVYYLGEKRAYFDQKTGKTYISVATLYHFNFYELEPANGQTKFLFQTEEVWKNPDFHIENGVLNYSNKNKTYSKKV